VEADVALSVPYWSPSFRFTGFLGGADYRCNGSSIFRELHLAASRASAAVSPGE
jgi:hypothetical protein